MGHAGGRLTTQMCLWLPWPLPEPGSHRAAPVCKLQGRDPVQP